MFLNFFFTLRRAGIKASLHEYLMLMDALKKEAIAYSVEDFYYLCKTVVVKHETQLDRFDMVFGQFFKGLEKLDDSFFNKTIPEEWLKRNLQRELSPEEKELIQSLGGLEELMKRFKELMDEQKERHEGGNKWIGTGGTSPFGVGGYNPEGFRVGGKEGHKGHRRAVKVWDKREFKNLDDQVELNTRHLKLALKRLRVLTREGKLTELDLNDTIQKTSENAGMLDISMVASKKNRVKVLLLMDIGGSMDDHVKWCERLFSAARYEFKHLEYFYFHNCIYEGLWKDNNRRFSERIPTLEIFNKYNKDYKVIIIGDAAMSPYEIIYKGGSVEHYNDEAGITWLERFKERYDYMIWINPNPAQSWNYFQSTLMLREFMAGKMFPLTLNGISSGMKALKNKKWKYGMK